MVVETAKNQIILNQILGQKKETCILETDVIVNDVKPDVFSIISTNGIVFIYKKEVMEGKIKIDGSINTYVMYLADDEISSVRSLNTSLDFTQIIEVEGCTEDMDTQLFIDIKELDTKVINGRKVNVKANLEISVDVFSNKSFEIITNVEKIKNAQILNNKQKIASLIGSGCNRVIAKDNIAVDVSDEVVEIMKVNFNIIDEEIKISYNKVLSKADALIEALYLTEDNRIERATTKIPIMGFVDIQNVNENCECDVSNSLSNLIVKLNNQEEHSISIEVETEVMCLAYEIKEIDVIEDLYSITENINFTKTEVDAITQRNRITQLHLIKENIRIPELTGKLLDIQAKPCVNNIQVRNGKVIYEGNLVLTVLFEQNSNIISRNIDLPFNFNMISDEIEEKSKIKTALRVKQNDFIVRDGIIEVTVGVEFILHEQKNKKFNIIEEIEVNEYNECNNYSMIIYFVKPGDTLWEIAKAFKSTVADIARINGIEDINKIRVGQQLYIPRFCESKINE